MVAVQVDPTGFEDTYRANPDPWGFAESPYELSRYDATIDALTRNRYEHAFEPGCSVGVLTERLARRADAVVACDPSPTAIERARQRLEGFDNVDLRVASLPGWLPEGTFDLLVFSELGYYWDLAGLESVLDALFERLRPRADVVAVHWLGRSDDHLLSGRDVHRCMSDRLGPATLSHLGGQQLDPHGAGFVLQRWEVDR